jgi:hypothetical protein
MTFRGACARDINRGFQGSLVVFRNTRRSRDPLVNPPCGYGNLLVSENQDILKGKDKPTCTYFNGIRRTRSEKSFTRTLGIFGQDRSDDEIVVICFKLPSAEGRMREPSSALQCVRRHPHDLHLPTPGGELFHSYSIPRGGLAERTRAKVL